MRVAPASTHREFPPLPLARTHRRTERMYQQRLPARKSPEFLFAARAGCATERAMPRTKKSIKNRSKVKKQALKRKRLRRNKGLRRGMRAK
jgi:hypothetical protein